MRKCCKNYWIVILVMTCLLCCLGKSEYTASTYDSSLHLSDAIWENPENGYQIYLDDGAELLTASEEEQLLETLKEITAYGNVAFVSISKNNYYSSKRFVDEYYFQHFGYASGTVFLIDMFNREIWIHSNGDIYNTVTTSYANTITDNVYAYASDSDYFKCADKAFEQILTLLQGRTIAQPMKYISNAFLAVILALLINYFLVMFLSRSRKASARQLLSGIHTKTDIKDIRADFIHQTRRYSPRNSGSSGGGSSRSGGGGGGSRGGGGGHRF